MMNKKAIAAFAAGATLLAGFAMATPAFAADAPKTPEAAKTPTTADLKKQYDEANKTLKGMTKPDEKKDKPADVTDPKVVACLKDENGTKVLDTSKEKTAVASDYAAAKKYADDLAAYNKKVKDYNDQEQKVNDLHAQYLASLEKDANTPKGEDPSDADYTAALQAASTKLQAADKNVRDAFAKANKLDGELKAAKAKASAALKAYTDFQNEHSDDMSKRDAATLGRLQKAKEDADAAVSKLEGKVSDAKGKYDEAFGKYDVAFGAYEKAYGDAKNHKESLVLGFVAPETAKLLRSDFQYGVGFVGSSDPFVAPGAPAGQPGKPGAPAAGANGAAGKAGAKTEVENKKDKDKRGNTHTGTGVGVTLTALAATMLAGMGAAVRKARH
ncbi:hypothetical protein HXT36_03690 [Gardnerella sp. DNF01144]|uniref:hypothetical protein n=1 Tax=Gardnerella sp. DNF01144 TaxID=2749058 RepID=UPI003BACA9FF